jgi:hypothetical protein
VETEKDAATWVMLEAFRGHQGTNKIRPTLLKKCIDLATEAKKIIEEERLYENDIRQ